MLTLNRADLLLHIGMELEIGWLPPLVVGARTVAQKSGARLAVLPTDIGAEAKMTSWAELVQAVIDELGRKTS